MIRGDAIAVVAEVEGRVVGICDIHRLRPNSELSHNGVLGIAVKKEYRNRGIGKDLIKMVLELSRRKFEMIRLEVFTVNSAAISLYRKLGFKEYGVSPSAVKRGDRYYDLLMMYYKF
jgi:ribosomal protein S18 acetylase RimI-like enzyme